MPIWYILGTSRVHRGHMRIAIGSKARSGKDTAADYIVRRYRLKKIPFSGKLYEITEHIQRTLGRRVEKDPALLQTIGNLLTDHYSPEIFIPRGDLNADGIVVSDLRSIAEYEYLKSVGYTTIRINRPNSIVDRNPDDITETALDTTSFDYVIENDGTIDELYKKIDAVIELAYS